MFQSFTRRAGSRRWRISILVVAAAGTLAALAGHLDSSPATPPVVLAACGTNPGCAGADPHVAASIVVDHKFKNEQGQLVAPVEPDDGETWTVAATWSAANGAAVCPCEDILVANATVVVSWSDTTDTWTATCTAGCDATNGPIFGVDICMVSACDSFSDPEHSWEYELIVNVDHTMALLCPNDTPPLVDRFLSKVAFTTTAVDDGDVIDVVNCVEDTAVSPTSQVFSANDTGAFECGFSCAAVSGTSVTITYE